MIKVPIIPQPVLRRLPKYLSLVEEMREKGTPWLPSVQIASTLRLTCSTVRQDFAHLDLVGVAKRGYPVEKLCAALHDALVENQKVRVAIVGAGHLGFALCAHGDLSSRGFVVGGIFDADPEISGMRVGSLSVQPLKQLRRVVRRKEIKIGIIAVPGEAAQTVATQLVAAGIEGILNLAYAQIRVPVNVSIIDARIVDSLQQLAYTVRNTKGRDEPVLGDGSSSLNGATL